MLVILATIKNPGVCVCVCDLTYVVSAVEWLGWGLGWDLVDHLHTHRCSG